MIETESFFISVLDEDTLKIVSKPNARMTYIEYDKLETFYRTLLPEKTKFKFLIILQEGFSLEKNPLDFIKHKIQLGYRHAEAYVIVSPILRMFVNVGIKIYKNRHPVRMFESEAQALKWLKDQ